MPLSLRTTVNVVEETADTIYLLFPTARQNGDELAEADLERVPLAR